MIPPSRPDLEVVGVFNPAVIRHAGEIVLLLRVAEAARPDSDREVTAPVYDADTGRLEVKRWRRGDEGVDTSDPRVVTVNRRTWLTSISHLRVALSTERTHFGVVSPPAL
jgi:predicted GH43/DUF377 family glycosyl hydrolase